MFFLQTQRNINLLMKTQHATHARKNERDKLHVADLEQAA